MNVFYKVFIIVWMMKFSNYVGMYFNFGFIVNLKVVKILLRATSYVFLFLI